jgi:hypothetical protein
LIYIFSQLTTSFELGSGAVGKVTFESTMEGKGLEPEHIIIEEKVEKKDEKGKSLWAKFSSSFALRFSITRPRQTSNKTEQQSGPMASLDSKCMLASSSSNDCSEGNS